MHVTLGTHGLTLELDSEVDTTLLGGALAELCRPGVVIGLVGPLGAGKTRLVRAIAESMGVDPAAISSPTFVLINEYAGRIPIYHADVYRLRDPAAFLDLGIADYWNGEGLVLVEWADRVRDLMPEGSWWIHLELKGPTRRAARFLAPRADAGLADYLATRLRKCRETRPC
jgi:tRNA threonylcarbamoyladenosine biosynthesis protein TsaE